jgi:hypothetical protein
MSSALRHSNLRRATTESLESRTLFAQMLFQVDAAQSVIALSAEAFRIDLEAQGANSLRAMYEGTFLADIDEDSVQFIGPDSEDPVEDEDSIGVIRAQMKNSYKPDDEPANYAGKVDKRIVFTRVKGDLAVRDLAFTITSGELPITPDDRFSTGPATFSVIDGRLDYDTDLGDGSEAFDDNTVENDGGAATITVVNGVTTLTIPIKVKFEQDLGVDDAELTLSGKIVAVSSGNLPLADLNGNSRGGFDNAPTYTVGVDTSINLTADDAQILDSDSNTLSAATVTLTNPLDGATLETLAADTTGTSIVASYDTTSGVLSLNGAGTIDEYESVLRSITYANDATDPTAGDRTITVVLNDGEQTGPVSTSVINIFDPNDIVIGGDAAVRTVLFDDADGTRTIITLAGPGSASIGVSGATAQSVSRGRLLIEGNVTINDITLTDTTIRSRLAISANTRTGDGRVTIGGVTATGGLATVGARNVDLAGDVTVGGLLRSVVFGNISGATIMAGSIGALTAFGTMDGSTVTATDATLDSPTIRSLVVRGATTNSIVTTPGRVTKVTLFGISGSDVTAASVGAFTVVGAMANTNVTTTGPLERVPSLGALSVRGAMTDSIVTTVGNIRSIVAFGMTNSAVYAGRAGTDGFPDDATDLPTETTISAVVMKRTRGTTDPLFANSVIAAGTLRSVALGLVDTDNAGTPFGLAADFIGVVVATNETGQTLRVRRLDDPATLGATLAATGFAFGDLEIRVF